VEAVLSSNRIFLAREDRPAARFVARNLTQLGLQAYVAGDATVPAIKKGDLLIVTLPAYPWTRTTFFDRASAARSSGARRLRDADWDGV
jgi:hypothetical protein